MLSPSHRGVNEQVKLRVNMIPDGEFVRAGKALDRAEIPLQLRKERFAGPADEESEPPQVIEESEPPMPKRLIRKNT